KMPDTNVVNGGRWVVDALSALLISDCATRPVARGYCSSDSGFHCWYSYDQYQSSARNKPLRKLSTMADRPNSPSVSVPRAILNRSVTTSRLSDPRWENFFRYCS